LGLVRAAGIEPASHAWEAHIIPVYYARIERRHRNGKFSRRNHE